MLSISPAEFSGSGNPSWLNAVEVIDAGADLSSVPAKARAGRRSFRRATTIPTGQGNAIAVPIIVARDRRWLSMLSDAVGLAARAASASYASSFDK
jgi:hypothetical protein